MDKFKAAYLPADEIAKITKAVAAAESRTSGEIVPMIVRRSSAIGHVPHACFLFLLCCSLAVFLTLEQWRSISGLVEMVTIAAIAISSYVLSHFLAQIPTIQRWHVTYADEAAQVWRRAHFEWTAHKLSHTENHTGILIFASVMERRAVILADEGVSKHCDPSLWREVVDLLTSHLRRDEWGLGFENAVRRCGEILAQHLPAGAKNPNELSDEIIVKP